jgi:hypothetical protein
VRQGGACQQEPPREKPPVPGPRAAPCAAALRALLHGQAGPALGGAARRQAAAARKQQEVSRSDTRGRIKTYRIRVARKQAEALCQAATAWKQREGRVACSTLRSRRMQTQSLQSFGGWHAALCPPPPRSPAAKPGAAATAKPGAAATAKPSKAGAGGASSSAAAGAAAGGGAKKSGPPIIIVPSGKAFVAIVFYCLDLIVFFGLAWCVVVWSPLALEPFLPSSIHSFRSALSGSIPPSILPFGSFFLTFFPLGLTAMLNMFNAKQLLQDGRFVPTAQVGVDRR